MSQYDNVFSRPFTGCERLKLVLLSLFAFCVLAVSLTFFALSIGKPHIGIILSTNPQG